MDVWGTVGLSEKRLEGLLQMISHDISISSGMYIDIYIDIYIYMIWKYHEIPHLEGSLPQIVALALCIHVEQHIKDLPQSYRFVMSYHLETDFHHRSQHFGVCKILCNSEA